MDILSIFTDFVPLIASSEEGSDAALAPLILLVSGFVYYGIIYARYRNADKRHSHEAETIATVENLIATDDFIKSKKGLSNAKMKNANHSRVEGALNTSGSGGITGMAKKLIS